MLLAVVTLVNFSFRYWESLDKNRSVPQGSTNQFDYDKFRAELDLSSNMSAVNKLT